MLSAEAQNSESGTSEAFQVFHLSFQEFTIHFKNTLEFKEMGLSSGFAL